MTLPASFLFWCFIPGRGVVKAVCKPTTQDPETAEVGAAICESDASWMKRPIPYQSEVQRRLDEAAADALHNVSAFLRSGDDADTALAGAVSLSQLAADAAEDRHDRARFTHPLDATPPAWME